MKRCSTGPYANLFLGPDK